jgi:predicted enzyme related to lactoylglutathione lyase
MMTKKRLGDAWMPAEEYGRTLPRFSVNLLVRDVARSVPFYRDVLGARVHYADADFAAMSLGGAEFMLHADHAYDHHPLYKRLAQPGLRGTGAELRVLGVDPDAIEARAKTAGAPILQPAMDFPHGWRDVMLEDPDGYIWAVGVVIPR